MKKFSDLLDIDPELTLAMELTPVGDGPPPEIDIVIGARRYSTVLYQDHSIQQALPLLDPVRVEIHLRNKIYSEQRETAVIIRSFSIDGHDIMPYLDIAVYQNDHGWTGTTNYLGFNGCWRWQLDRAFYQWWHVASGQGWLLEP